MKISVSSFCSGRQIGAVLFAAFSLIASDCIHAQASDANTNSRVDAVKTPITGSDDPRRLNEAEQALSQFYKAFNDRNLDLIDANFAASDEVAIDNPLGGILRGAHEPHKMYKAIFSSPADVHVEFWDYTITQVGDVFWAVGRERGAYKNGADKVAINIRTSRTFRKISGAWRQVHHHGSIEEPKALADFQAAVRRPQATPNSSASAASQH